VLGLYDSGLGGLTVLGALRAAGIDQDVIYFADQAHVPYGDRGDAELHALLAENFALLDAYGIDAVVMACNTSCAVASRQGGFPAARFAVLDLIENAARSLARAPYRNLAVIATSATVRNGAYARAIARHAPLVRVTEIAAPALVPLVESGRVASDEAAAAVRAVCHALPPGIDAVVYGCTHFPLLERHFSTYLPAAIAQIDPAVAQAAATAALVRELRLPPGRSITQYRTNGDRAKFEASVRAWTALPISS
jgi:glutamate racemase